MTEVTRLAAPSSSGPFSAYEAATGANSVKGTIWRIRGSTIKANSRIVTILKNFLIIGGLLGGAGSGGMPSGDGVCIRVGAAPTGSTCVCVDAAQSQQKHYCGQARADGRFGHGHIGSRQQNINNAGQQTYNTRADYGRKDTATVHRKNGGTNHHGAENSDYDNTHSHTPCWPASSSARQSRTVPSASGIPR